jgi:micrococcal nuclease
MRHPVLSSALVLVLAGCAVAGGRAGQVTDDGRGTVVRVLDGDTLDIEIAGATERVRLIGVDTPEIAHPAMGSRPANPAECYGDAAKRYTASLFPEGTQVELARDVVPRDDYGRLLAYVYRHDDRIFLNYELARQGYAQPLTIEPNSAFRERIVDAAVRAEHEGAGLWSACR